jgi:hypothetical protein
MKNAICLLSLVGALLAAGPVQARDDVLTFSIEGALNTPDAKEKITPDVALFWGDQAHPKSEKEFGTFTTNRKTNAFGKSDQTACEWVFLSAVIELQKRARDEGGNAVVDIHSYYKSVDFSSQTEFKCGAGSFVAGVALRGTVVKLP